MMRTLIAKDPRNAERIFPYIGGEEINTDPRHQHRRFVIDFRSMREDQARGWPDLMDILERRVRPERIKQASIVNPDRWWMHARSAGDLYIEISKIPYMIAICRVAPQFTFARIPTNVVPAESTILFAFSDWERFSILQSRSHELWSRFLSSSMKDDLRYTPSDCFRTFPFPAIIGPDRSLDETGEAYHAFRAQLMIARNEGLTKTYNRFHARGENGGDITRLRALHHEMDAAVLRAYSWDDLADRAAPEFVEQDADEGKTPKTRLDWPSEFKDEVLARLLALNAERAAEERAQGLTATSEDDVDGGDDAGEG
jgi:hypothetical protein